MDINDEDAASNEVAEQSEQVKQVVQEVRRLEANTRSHLKHANDIVKLRGVVADDSAPSEARMAAVHALRRTFLWYAEKGWNHREVVDDKQPSSAPSSSQKASKAKEYNAWFVAQYQSFLKTLLKMIADSNETQYHALAIRTYIEVILIIDDQISLHRHIIADSLVRIVCFFFAHSCSC